MGEIIRIHPDSQERILKALSSYTVQELLWVINHRYMEQLEQEEAFSEVVSPAEPTCEACENQHYKTETHRFFSTECHSCIKNPEHKNNFKAKAGSGGTPV